VGLDGLLASQKPFVLLFLAALEKCLLRSRLSALPSGAGVGAAIRNYSQVETAAAVSQ